LCFSASEEMNAQWDIPLHVDTSLAAFVRGVLPTASAMQTTDSSSGGSNNRSDGGSHASAERLLHQRGDSRHSSGTAAVSCFI